MFFRRLKTSVILIRAICSVCADMLLISSVIIEFS